MRRVALLLSLAILATAPVASAFERQWHVGGGGGVAILAEPGAKAGPLVGLHGAYGISDEFDVRVALLGSAHRLDGEPFDLYAATAGLAYKLDVLSWIPYAGVALGYYRLGKGPRPGDLSPNEPGFSVDLGLDYAVIRHFGVGVELRYHGFLGEGFTSLGDAPYFTGLLRAEYRWGW